MHLNHPGNHPPSFQLVENLSSRKLVPGAEKVGNPCFRGPACWGGGHPSCLCQLPHSCLCPPHSPVLRKLLAKCQEGLLTLGQALN